MKAFVRYLAVNTPRPEAMADYYKKYFGLSESFLPVSTRRVPLGRS